MYSLIAKKDKYLAFLKPNNEEDTEAFKRFAVEYYHFFLELRDIYYDNKIYESIALREAFHTLLHNHEMESSNYRDFARIKTEEDLIKNVALFELKHKVVDGFSEFERNLENVIRVIYSDLEKLS